MKIHTLSSKTGGIKVLLLTAAALAFAANEAEAENYYFYWKNADGSWYSPSNWSSDSPEALPTGEDVVIIRGSDIARVGIAGEAATAQSIELLGTDALLEISAGSLTLGHIVQISQSGSDIESTGGVSVSGGEFRAKEIYVGYDENSKGKMSISGGKVFLNNLCIANASFAGTSGQLIMTGGELLINEILYLGGGGAGSLLLNGGTISTKYMHISGSTPDDSKAIIAGGELNCAETLFITVGDYEGRMDIMTGGKVTAKRVDIRRGKRHFKHRLGRERRRRRHFEHIGCCEHRHRPI